jgi:hypothetical protein
LLTDFFPPAGHGGARAAEFVKQNLFTNLIKHPKFFSDTKSAIGIITLCSCYSFEEKYLKF